MSFLRCGPHTVQQQSSHGRITLLKIFFCVDLAGLDLRCSYFFSMYIAPVCSACKQDQVNIRGSIFSDSVDDCLHVLEIDLAHIPVIILVQQAIMEQNTTERSVGFWLSRHAILDGFITFAATLLITWMLFKLLNVLNFFLLR